MIRSPKKVGFSATGKVGFRVLWRWHFGLQGPEPKPCESAYPLREPKPLKGYSAL